MPLEMNFTMLAISMYNSHPWRGIRVISTKAELWRITRIFSHIKLDSRPLTATNRGIQMRAAFLNFTPKDTSFIALSSQVVDEKAPFLLALSAIGHNHWVTESIYYTPTLVALPDARARLSQYDDSQISPFCRETIILTNAPKEWLFFFPKH